MQKGKPNWGQVVSIRIKPEVMARLNAYRRQQRDPPSRSQAIAQLLEYALGTALATEEAAE